MNRHPFPFLLGVVVLFFSASFKQPQADAAIGGAPMIVLSLSGDMFSQSRVYLSKLGMRITCKQGYALWFTAEPKNVWLVNPDNKTYLIESFEKYAKDEQSEYGPNNYIFKDSPEIEVLTGSEFKVRLRRYTNYLEGTDKHAPNFAKLKRTRRKAEVVYIDDQPIPAEVKKHWCALVGLTGNELSPRTNGLPVGLGRRIKKKWMGIKRFTTVREKWLQILELKAFANQPLDSKIYAKPVGYKPAKDKTSLYLSGDGNMKDADIEEFFQRRL
jgi:hypothetical protein